MTRQECQPGHRCRPRSRTRGAQRVGSLQSRPSVRQRGPRIIDVDRHLRWKQQLIAAPGGSDQLAPGQAGLVKAASDLGHHAAQRRGPAVWQEPWPQLIGQLLARDRPLVLDRQVGEHQLRPSARQHGSVCRAFRVLDEQRAQHSQSRPGASHPERIAVPHPARQRGCGRVALRLHLGCQALARLSVRWRPDLGERSG